MPHILINTLYQLPLQFWAFWWVWSTISSCFSVAKLCLTLWGPYTAAYQVLCLLLSLRICPNSCPLRWWCYLTISSSSTLFSFCLQCFPASMSFPISRLFTSSGQSTVPSSSVTILLVNIQGWFPLGLVGLSSLQSKSLSRVFLLFLVGDFNFLTCGMWKFRLVATNQTSVPCSGSMES